MSSREAVTATVCLIWSQHATMLSHWALNKWHCGSFLHAWFHFIQPVSNIREQHDQTLNNLTQYKLTYAVHRYQVFALKYHQEVSSRVIVLLFVLFCVPAACTEGHQRWGVAQVAWSWGSIWIPYSNESRGTTCGTWQRYSETNV